MTSTRELRSAVPRSSHADGEPDPNRIDPVVLLRRQARRRIPELVPIRHGRMLASPFAFFRGAAAVMAADLARTPVTGLRVQLCGDAHLANFGVFAAPDRTLVFDVNDFDETLPGPWEWDVKRLAASVEVAARERAFDGGDAVLTVVRTYRETMRAFAGMRTLDVWYARLEVEAMFARFDAAAGERIVARARAKDNLRAFEKLTHTVDGTPRIVSDPPLIVPIEALADVLDHEAELRRILSSYRLTLPDDRRHLLDRYKPVHFARKVVGVGSVGTDAWVVLLIGRDASDPLFLQVKEAQASVLEPFAGHSAYAGHGRRVVEGQRLMQASGDIMLGWLTGERGVDGRKRDYYVRQLWDEKGSARLDRLAQDDFAAYAGICGWTLARAHARSGDRQAIAAYLGAGENFDKAVARFAAAYADQNERDHATLVEAVKRGRIPAETGL
jgi:uncharacterized protein (DUF2252 family)